MNVHIEQRAVVKFLVAENVPPHLILSRLQNVFGDECLSRSQVFEWSKRFKEGHRSLDDEERPGRPLTATDPVTVERVQQLVREDRRVTLKYISNSVGISIGAAHEVVHGHLGMSKVCARWLPNMLIPQQKQARVEACQQLLDQVRELDDAFMQRLVTQDESWFHLRDRSPSKTAWYGSRPLLLVLQSSKWCLPRRRSFIRSFGTSTVSWCSGRLRRVAQLLDSTMQTSGTTKSILS